MQYELVPYELQQIPQWVCYNGSKVPLNARTGGPASSTDPATWSSYGEAVQSASKFNGIGFVLTANDPYTFIDLDYNGGDPEVSKLQRQVFEYLDSYTEYSPSGRGLHIIVRADCPVARRSNHIEVYGSKRYMTMTGQVFHNRPIEERQLHVEKLLAKLGRPKTVVPIVSAEQTLEDSEVWAKMVRAVNGDAIKALANGEWQQKYGSQSEADFALINHLVWHTQCAEQVARMFRTTLLGVREKAQRDDYIYNMIARASDQIVPTNVPHAPVINLAKIKSNLLDSPTSTMPTPPPATLDCFPPGLLGEVAQFVYDSYPRPVPEIALAGAIGLMSGVCGRAYNVSGTGLNMYTLLLAQTGTGKDAMAQGISRIRREVAKDLPFASEFIGPNLASGQALSRHLAEKSPSFVSVFGEWGKQLRRITAANATMADRALAELFLQLYSKSGKNIYLPGTVFADTAKNTKDLLSPSFSVLAEATPETYYSVIDEHAIADGLLPRFLVIEYAGKRVPRQNVDADPRLHTATHRRLVDLCSGVLTMQAENIVIDVALTPSAEAFLDQFDTSADMRINQSSKDTTRQLWNRAHLKALKLAALLAVGVNPHAPTIEIEHARWAQHLVEMDVQRVLSRFDTGEFGQESDASKNFDKRVKLAMRVLLAYPEYDPNEPSNSNIRPGMQETGVIPHSVLRRHLVSYPPFRKTQHRNPGQQFEETLKHLIEDEVLGAVSSQYLMDTYGYRGKAYKILSG